MDTLAKRVLYDRQVELEERMSSRGIIRYRKNLEQSLPSNNLSGISLMKKTVGEVEQGIIEYLEDTFLGNAGRGNSIKSARLLNMVSPDVSAYLALKTTIDHMSLNPALTATAMRIAGFIEDEFKFDLFKKQEPRLYGAVKVQVSKRTSNRHYMRYNLIHTMNKHALLTYEPWSRSEKLHLGCKLLDIIVRTTGLIEKGKIGQGRRSKLIIQPTKGALEWVTEVNRNGESLSPSYAPCIIPPKEWTSVYSGGYWSEHIRPLPLVKTTNRCILEEFDNHEMPLEYKAINALQNTAWRVNTAVLSVVEQLWDRGGSWAGLPSRESLPIPTCPLPKDLAKADMSVIQAEQFKMWKRRASVVYNKNAKMASKRLTLIRTIQMAKEYKDELFFVYQNDFRSRKYAVSSFLNPQGTDYTKALLHFAKGKPIDSERAFHWLCIQGANTFGNDKVAFDQRQRWVEEHEEFILKVALDPLGYSWWCDASDPFQFLAFCFEYAGFKRDGWGFVSHLPIALDGRNNGLQHLSALGLDEVGGKATCLVPSDTPEDMYQMVYEKLWEKVEADADNPMAQLWLAFGASRKTVKRPIMVIPYGGSRFSCSEYIQDYINEMIDAGHEDVFGDDQFKGVLYLSNLLWDAANEAVPAARKIMAYLQAVGKSLSAENLPVIWMTPTGFWIHQMYPDTVARRITTHIDGVLIKPQLRIDNFKAIDKRRAVNGIAPNFVHGNDASAMTLTICKGVDNGIDSFAMIHDSYGTHACDTDKLGSLLREAFVEIYRVDRLEEFASHAREVLGDDTPSPPPKGNLDIEQVLESKYFFA